MGLIKSAIAASVAMIVASAAPAAAQTFTPDPRGSFALNQDTPDGNYSVWSMGNLEGLNSLRARVTVPRVAQRGQWMPTFSITLEGEGEKNGVIFRLQTRPGQKTLIATLSGRGAEEGMELFLLPIELNETFDLEIDWSADGKVTAIVRSKAAKSLNGFERHEITMAGAPRSLRISGSSGEIDYGSLQLGRVTP